MGAGVPNPENTAARKAIGRKEGTGTPLSEDEGVA